MLSRRGVFGGYVRLVDSEESLKRWAGVVDFDVDGVTLTRKSLGLSM